MNFNTICQKLESIKYDSLMVAVLDGATYVGNGNWRLAHGEVVDEKSLQLAAEDYAIEEIAQHLDFYPKIKALIA
ncbi:hypothetical protein VZG28_04950 [Synechococcus elongatus IITB4]|uniref:hypothetical protein n=1 Tax=Synechococcus elongatus TaxID=32046 RepID=UPI0030CFB26E